MTARCQHAAVESAINALEIHGLDRCPDQGIDGFKRYVALAVVARNIQQLGAHLKKKKVESLHHVGEKWLKQSSLRCILFDELKGSVCPEKREMISMLDGNVKFYKTDKTKCRFRSGTRLGACHRRVLPHLIKRRMIDEEDTLQRAPDHQGVGGS